MDEGSVEFAKVSYALPSSASGDAGRLLLKDVSLRIEAGTTTALLGRSGSGKTTLLRMVNGLVRPTSGEVRVSGRMVGESDPVELRRGIGYVIQETGLFPHMTVERNAGMALELAGRSDSGRVRDVLGLAGIEYDGMRERYPWQLSGGQRQRVGVARALAMDPPVMLMDEPFGALDPLTRAEMQTMLRELMGKVRKTVLLVTHDLDEALYLAQRVVFLEAGVVVADLAAGDVLGSSNAKVREYVGAVHRAVRN
ncbi:ATP-binding cassette domain-containing protein [Granulicella sibirica]|uniref:L-proline glycine betaine ABC transport system permease protein ProV n=1 Tax=Granulicella sibirica TaxID=2479048 RepID=A0A4Q0T0S1_9BACT|nr:ATP-binding cassette domain-containing protein [Granulicella sibirica]RXH55930.1 L-proline glycine betaine ABC transport system permease protein ProV [Granulicella sibirica]